MNGRKTPAGAPPRRLTVAATRGEAKPRSPLNIFVALLRGVNVGGKNLISMSSLKATFEKMGFQEVTTYINSGNILFRTKAADARKLERDIERRLLRDHKLDRKVVVRNFPEIAALIENLPKDWNDDKSWRYNVIFLRHTIDSEIVLQGLGAKPGIEQVVYRPGTLLWSARIADLPRSTMLKLSSQKIFQEMTVRNPNTTRKIYELMKRMADG